MQDHIQHYARLLSKMRTAAGSKNYPSTAKHRAPHKPFLLLTIFDLFEQGTLTSNIVFLSSDLSDTFASYWALLMPPDRVGHIFLPFFHMKNDGFWHLVPQPGKEDALNVIQQMGGPGQLRELVLGGQLDAGLYDLLCIKEARDIIRGAILSAYFTDDVHDLLVKQANINVFAHQYSVALLEQARANAALSAAQLDEAQQAVRDQGFRKAVVTAYDHRCVMCGVRLMTSEGRTAATAAHIIPWSVSHNDDPRNGLCLCRLCHWAFDIGLSTITTKYRIRLSPQLNAAGNMPGYLSTLNDRPIFEPIEDVFNPDTEALGWHTREVFLSK